MPLVIINTILERDPRIDGLLANLASIVAGVVAKELDVPNNPEARTTLSDFEVQVRRADHLDYGGKCLSITILANDSLDRRVNLDERRANIARVIREYVARWEDEHRLPPIVGAEQGFVWLLLVPSSFEYL